MKEETAEYPKETCCGSQTAQAEEDSEKQRVEMGFGGRRVGCSGKESLRMTKDMSVNPRVAKTLSW